MQRIEKAAPNRASEALLDFIREKYGSIPVFCDEHPKLKRLQVQKAIRGLIKRIDVTFAAAVEDATGGAVFWRWWIGLDGVKVAKAAKAPKAAKSAKARAKS